MKAVIAIDSLKGSLSSIEAGQAIAEGIKKADAKAEVVIRPLADGGEGTVEALVCGMNGTLQHVKMTGPLGEPVVCEYGIIDETKTAVIEMSGAAGITLVPDTKKNPLYTTTYGVGEVIRDAIEKGCRRFIVGIGGSATNDGGIGMLQALGYGFLNKDGQQVPFGAIGLKELETITDTYVLPELAECEFKIACDVTNPLCGENGCSAVYGPQKGANPSMIMEMDKWLRYYAALAREKFPKADLNEPGTGAAGGLGFAFLTFTNAVLESGIKIVLEETKLESYVKGADVVVTGEGRLDFQTAMGKAPVGVAGLAKKFDIPVLAFAGSVTKDATECNKNGIDAFFPILRGISTLEEAMKPENAKQNLIDTAEQAFRLFNICRQA
ncbi:MAG: glycerate kinase [Coprococcus sp.]